MSVLCCTYIRERAATHVPSWTYIGVRTALYVRSGTCTHVPTRMSVARVGTPPPDFAQSERTSKSVPSIRPGGAMASSPSIEHYRRGLDLLAAPHVIDLLCLL